jgi:hypothetical protein
MTRGLGMAEADGELPRPKPKARRKAIDSPDPVEIAMRKAADELGQGPAHLLLQAHERLAGAQLQLARNELFRGRFRAARDISFAVLAVALVAAIAWAVAAAASSRAVVIEAFSVPPELARRGLTGEVVAQRFLDRLGEMQSKSNSVRAPASFADAWSGNLEVEIPSTGVSLDDISRALRGWLSNDTRVTGEVLVEANNLRVAARASGKAPAEATGPAEALDATLQQAAEQFFAQQQPYLYAIYLQNEGRTDEALAVTRSLALTGPPGERAGVSIPGASACSAWVSLMKVQLACVMASDTSICHRSSSISCPTSFSEGGKGTSRLCCQSSSAPIEKALPASG